MFGLGALVALAAGVVLWLGLGSAAESTRRLIQERSDTVLDGLERELRNRLDPVTEQAAWITSLVADGTLDLRDEAGLDAFMFGALAATPQVAGIGFFRPGGTGRVWLPGARTAFTDDRSGNEQFIEWLRAGKATRYAAWQDPIWVEYLGKAAVLQDSPLRRDGRFLGMLGQIVLVEELSRGLVGNAPPFTTPFVLHRGGEVLAHPQLIDWSPQGIGEWRPLATIAEVGDPVLAGLGTESAREGRWLVQSSPDVEVTWVVLDDAWHLVLQRRVSRFGDWSVGVHIDTDRNEDQGVRAMLEAAGAGVAVLVVAVVLAVLVGRRISRPVRAIAAAARVVEGDRLDEVRPLRPSWILEMDDANRSFNRMVEGLRERGLIRRTLGRYVPEKVAHALLSAGGRIEPMEVRATVLFCDLVGFTSLTERLGPTGIVDVINDWFSRMTDIIERRGGTVIQFQGDAILATFNVPVADPEHASQAVRAALEMQAETSVCGTRRDASSGAGSGSAPERWWRGRSARPGGSATPCTAMRSTSPRGSKPSTASAAPPSSSAARPPRGRRTFPSNRPAPPPCGASRPPPGSSRCARNLDSREAEASPMALGPHAPPVPLRFDEDASSD